MDGTAIFTTILLLCFIVETRTQFFDFFGFPQNGQNTNIFGNDFTTRRTKIDTVRTISRPESDITWTNTTYSIIYEGIDRDDDRDRDTSRESSREKKRKNTVLSRVPTLLPVFNFYTTTTQKAVRKSHKATSARRNATNSASGGESSRRKSNSTIRIQLANNVDVTQQANNRFERPENVIVEAVYAPPTFIVTTIASNNIYYNNNDYTTKRNNDNKVIYNNDNYNNGYNTNNNNYNANNGYTTKNPFFDRPGVKPAVIDNRPPITNKPPTKRPSYQRPTTPKPVTNKPTVRPYIVNPIPTDSGAIVYPHEDEPPEIIRGPDEDYMSEAEKRRYIEEAERMCDKYKALNTKQLQAIPLLPSPEPVAVNVSKCTPTTVPLVVGGKVVNIRDFPHTTLLGWIKIDGGGYSWKCGGSLISEQYVLTAAHCSFQERDNTVVTGPPRVVQLGSTFLDDPGALVVRVAAVVRHPRYKFPRSYYDIALLRLIQAVTFSEVIKPACLGVPPPVHEPLIAVGWGRTEFGGDQSLELRAVSLPVWDMSRCRDVLGSSRKMPQGPSSDSQLCAGDERGGKDTCQGDSGGPAQIQDGCVWRIVAVTSLGRSCGAPNTPGLYSLVLRPFIAATVFGTKNNNRRSDNSQPSYNSNHRQNDYTTTESYLTRRTTTTTTESYYNHQQNHENHGNNYNIQPISQGHYRPDSYDNTGYTNNNRQPNDYSTQISRDNDNRGRNYDSSYYNQPGDYTGSNHRQNPSSNQNYYNNQRENGYWAGSNNDRRNNENYEGGRVWWTKK